MPVLERPILPQDVNLMRTAAPVAASPARLRF